MSYSVSQPPASQKRPLQDHSNRPMYDSQKYTQGLKPGAPPVAYCHPEQNQIHQGTQTFGFNQGSHYHYQNQNQYGHSFYPNVQFGSLPYPPGYAFQNNSFPSAHQRVHPQENGFCQGFHSQGLMMMNQRQQMQSNAMSRVPKVPELKSNEKWRTRHGKNDRIRIQGQHIGKSMFEAVSVSKHPFAIFAPYSSR